ncbi:MAG: hypothetical protein QW206_05095 [Acidilobaceae archaeon]
MSLRIYIVLPDLSITKIKAIEIASREADFGILVSYSIIKMKPVVLERLSALRSKTEVSVMLDSGAYHLAKLGLEVGVRDYADLILKHNKLFDIVVAPDVPGDCSTTLARTREFAKVYRGEFMPVVQGKNLKCYKELEEISTTVRGIGGLDGDKRRTSFIASVVRVLPKGLHLFGVGARAVAGLSKAGLLDKVVSVDSSGWLAEIRFRRRSVLGADGVVEANAKAIQVYIERVKKATDKTKRTERLTIETPS